MKFGQYHVSNKLAGYLLAFLLVFSAVCSGQATVIISPVPQLQFFSQSGAPLSFGCVFTYQTNSTTPLGTYTDYTGSTLNQNPVILSAGGSANIWIQAGVAYSFRVKSSGGTNCSSGATLYTVNGIGGGTSTLTTVVPYSATPVFQDASQNQLFEITLTGNASSQPLTAVGIIPPGLITWQITQDGTGGHTFTWPANVIGGCTIGSAANQVTTQFFIWNGTNATATGPCVTGTGPVISAGNIYDYGLTVTSAICTDANHQLITGSGCNSALGVTYNGQTVQPGGSGNVNSGAATHSLALNEGNGNAMTGLTLGASQIAIGVASADPAASTLPTCSGGTALTYSGTAPLTCIAPTVIQANSITLASGNVTVAQNVGTTFLTKAVTFPSSGCPCRALVSYGAYLDSGSSGIATAWVDDGTNQYATAQTLNNDAGGQGPGISATSMSPVTYANGASITFTAKVNMTNSGGGTVEQSPAASTQKTWLSISIFTSN